MRDFKGPEIFKKVYENTISNYQDIYCTGKNFSLLGTHGIGKQLCLDTDIPTVKGFVKLKDLKEGDELFDENGDVCKVLQLHPINISPESYEIEFDDGSKVKACSDHLWLTWDRESRKEDSANHFPKVRSTKEILNTLAISPSQPNSNHSIVCSKPINYPKKELIIGPYTLGCWLGDGSSSSGNIECADQEILDGILKEGYSVNLSKGTVRKKSKSSRYRIGDLVDSGSYNHSQIGILFKQLRTYNLPNNKHIPNDYLYSSYEDRLSLLQGLLDTDGCCSKLGVIEFCTVLPELANQVKQLICSLGIKTKIKQNESYLNGTRHKDRYRITFTTNLPVFKVKRKLERIKLKTTQKNRTLHRYIVSIKPIESIPMRCITVDSKSHLFLITNNFIPTHNTTVAASILKKMSEKNYNCTYTTLTDIINVIIEARYEDRFEAKKELVQVDFLVIDELDNRFIGVSENAIDLFGRSLESIIRTRMSNKLPTIFISNSPNPMESFTGSFKASIGSLMSGVKEFVARGDDHRRKLGN